MKTIHPTIDTPMNTEYYKVILHPNNPYTYECLLVGLIVFSQKQA